jgi:hypothetical protein
VSVTETGRKASPVPENGVKNGVRDRFPVLAEPNIAASILYASQVRIEDEGAIYHVMARGNRRNRIFTFQ